MTKLLSALGLMSGTSGDGIDIALLETDGDKEVHFYQGHTYPYDQIFRQKIFKAMQDNTNVDLIKSLEEELTYLHSQAVQSFLTTIKKDSSTIDVIGFHGQTLIHKPHDKITKQIGNGELLAKLTGIKVVNDFRTQDVLEGGQGAPLVPIYHHALTRSLQHPLAVVNIGGVANVTWINHDDPEKLIAFDTGPGNALIDDWVSKHSDNYYDYDGSYARQGKIHPELLDILMDHHYFSLKPPKSLDRYGFDVSCLQGLSFLDGTATLTAFTVESIVKSVQYFPEPVQLWLVTGGGRHNKTLMQNLQERLKVTVKPVEAFGWEGDSLEAQAFAYCAVRFLKKLPISFPKTTGVIRPIYGGHLSLGLS
ncbi:MAG: anhydro-N-acetylmuramic acid kinase [Alphaproteobacteria bacterium]|nr:anhydro-N-acetylmuramic acid kinase [Alphaproteobacteria bacterium]